MAITKQDAITPVYKRDTPPGRPEKLSVYTSDELRKIELVIGRMSYLAPQVAEAAPTVKYKGMIRYATSPWNPLGTGDAWVWWNGAAWAALDTVGVSYTDEQAQDALAAAFAAGTHTGITITYTDGSNKFDFVNTAGTIQSGTAEVDFGAFPGSTDCSLAVIGQAGIIAGSKVFAGLRLVASADHSADEHLVEAIQILVGNIVAGTGFTIYARDGNMLREQDPVLSGIGPRIYGKWEVSWVWF